jgi:hypothetical protein
MHVLNRKQAFTSPEAVFPYPGAVVHSSGLTDNEKVVVLRNWRKGLIRLQKSAAGTALQDGPGDVDPQLQDVEAAIMELNRNRPA